MSFSDIESTSAMVHITPREGNPAVERIDVTVGHGSNRTLCKAYFTHQPLSCVLSGLMPDHTYTAHAAACLPGAAGCGPALTGRFRTCMIGFRIDDTLSIWKLTNNRFSFLI